MSEMGVMTCSYMTMGAKMTKGMLVSFFWHKMLSIGSSQTPKLSAGKREDNRIRSLERMHEIKRHL